MRNAAALSNEVDLSNAVELSSAAGLSSAVELSSAVYLSSAVDLSGAVGFDVSRIVSAGERYYARAGRINKGMLCTMSFWTWQPR